MSRGLNHGDRHGAANRIDRIAVISRPIEDG